MTTEVASRCSSYPVSPASHRGGRVGSMTSSSPTSGHEDELADNNDAKSSGGQAPQQQQQRLSFGISQILQSDDRRRHSDYDDITSGGDTAESTMALIRSAFGSYMTAAGCPSVGVAGLPLVGATGTGNGLYTGNSGVIRVPAQRLSTAAVCVGQQATATAAAACRLSAMMFPWMRERKDGLTCT